MIGLRRKDLVYWKIVLRWMFICVLKLKEEQEDLPKKKERKTIILKF